MISGQEWPKNYPSLLEENKLQKKKMTENERRAVRVCILSICMYFIKEMVVFERK